MASRIRELRKQSGMTQGELARRCRVSRSAVALWETEQTQTLKPGHLFAAASALGVDAQYLLTGKTTVASGYPDLSARSRAMLEAYALLPEHLQVQVGALVQSMAMEREDDDERTDKERQ